MQAFRTVLEQKIRERRQTLEEFVEYAETFAREHKETGTLSLRHLQRLIAGYGSQGRPLGQLRPATARLLENIFGRSVDELLSSPAQPTSDDLNTAESSERLYLSSRPVDASNPPSYGALADIRSHDRQGLSSDTSRVIAGDSGADLSEFFEWLDGQAGWVPDTSRRKVMSRLAKTNLHEMNDRQYRHARVTRTQVADALTEYYSDCITGYGSYRAYCGKREIVTSIFTREDWLDLGCALAQDNDRLTLIDSTSEIPAAPDEIGSRQAVRRLTEAAALDVRVANVPLYRLLTLDAKPRSITGTVGVAPFVEYALTMDLLEGELVDALAAGAAVRGSSLPLRDRYLPDVASVLDVSGRMCAGGALALCAVARPFDQYGGAPDYALLVQQRSRHVLNATRRLSVIPKAFHQPLTDARADAQLGVTLRRELEEELFGRSEVDSTVGERRAAVPMHPGRLSEPMRWLMGDPGRLRMECTGFGLNLVSGNYEFASLIVIEDEEFWTRYGGQIEANWEASGLRLYSSLDDQLITELMLDESWSNEGLFALLQGLRRLGELGGDRVNLPVVEWNLANRS